MGNEFACLDVGCGFIPNWTKRRRGLGIDIRKGQCDVQADAHRLPFRDNIFSFIYMDAVLEHLDNPFHALREAKRVAKLNCVFDIIIPIDARGIRSDFSNLIKGFPFSVIETYKKYWIGYKYKPIGHKNMIQPYHIQRFFRILKCELRGSHQWLHGRKGKLIRKVAHLPPSFGGRDYHILAECYPDKGMRY